MPNVIYEMGGDSADGHIVGPDGKSDWSVPDEVLRRFHNEQPRACRPPVGRRSYQTMVYWDPTDIVREFAPMAGAAEGGVIADAGPGRGSEHDARAR